jgi:hypothetical protein
VPWRLAWRGAFVPAALALLWFLALFLKPVQHRESAAYYGCAGRVRGWAAGRMRVLLGVRRRGERGLKASE